MSEESIVVAGSVAYGHNIQTGYFTDKAGTRTNLAVRVSDVYRKINRKWLIVQEHVSFPVDIATGKADLMSKPRDFGRQGPGPGWPYRIRCPADAARQSPAPVLMCDSAPDSTERTSASRRRQLDDKAQLPTRWEDERVSCG
jgi:hypothetical protein